MANIYRVCFLMAQYRDEELLQKISAKIKKLRMQNDVPLEKFYEDTKINLSRVEYSKANISISTLRAICNYFWVSLHEFFKEIDK